MKLRYQLGMALLLQGGGGMATLLAALWLGRALGPEQQGQFNQIKAAIEFGTALAALGMPQAMYVFAQSGRLALPAARRLGARVALLGIPVGAGVALWSLGAVGVALPLAMAAAVTFACLQTQWRALTLLADASWRFNLVTVVPQLLLLPLAAWVVALGGVADIALAGALALTWVLASAYAGWELGRVPVSGHAHPAVPLGALSRHGLATWATTSLATLAVVLLQRSALAAEGAAGLGPISLALLLAQVPLTPLNYALPLLLRHRLKASGASARMARRAPLVALPMAALALLALALGSVRSDLWLGSAYDGLHGLVAWLMLAGMAEAVMRVFTVDAQAEGQPWRSAWAEGVRVLVLLLGFHAGGSLGFARPIEALAAWWALAAFAALGVLWALTPSASPEPHAT